MDNNSNFKTFYEKAYLLFPIFNGRVSELESRHAELCELVKIEFNSGIDFYVKLVLKRDTFIFCYK